MIWIILFFIALILDQSIDDILDSGLTVKQELMITSFFIFHKITKGMPFSDLLLSYWLPILESSLNTTQRKIIADYNIAKDIIFEQEEGSISP